MRNRGQVVIGAVIIVVGLVWLLGAVFHIDMGKLCLPAALIAVGIYLLARPAFVGPDTALRASLFGPVRRGSDWEAKDEEIWLFIGDVRLDLAQAQLPAGETRVRIVSFVGDVRLKIPAGVGVSIASTAFVSTIRAFGQKREILVAPVHLTNEGYEAAECKIRLETFSFISEVGVEQG
jgi:predicted membrane protein